jgi:hypothetical protein
MQPESSISCEGFEFETWGKENFRTRKKGFLALKRPAHVGFFKRAMLQREAWQLANQIGQ